MYHLTKETQGMYVPCVSFGCKGKAIYKRIPIRREFGIQITLHIGSTLIVFDITNIPREYQLNT
jgi:hypothetical protein